MEKSVDWQFDSYMQEIFQMKEVDIREYSPLALAYIGDCIFDLVIKSLVMNEGNKQVQKMHKETSSYVQASALVLLYLTSSKIAATASAVLKSSSIAFSNAFTNESV